MPRARGDILLFLKWGGLVQWAKEARTPRSTSLSERWVFQFEKLPASQVYSESL